MFLRLFPFLSFLSLISASPLMRSGNPSVISRDVLASESTASSSCFPAVGFKMPSGIPGSLDGWWCSFNHEYAFMGFSYEVTACQSRAQLNREFSDMRYHFNSRYVRLYGACDNKGFYDDIVDAAWNNGLGVHALIWFGFDGSDKWMARRDSLINTLLTNPKAKFVTRAVQFGSEPLFDDVLTPAALAAQVISAKARLAAVGILVTVSELVYGYQERGGAQDVLNAEDFFDIHMLPFFSSQASTADKAWPLVANDLKWITDHGNGKKVFFDENGWPSVTSPGVQPNSPKAVANVQNEQDYFNMLDQHCEDLKMRGPDGGVGWFAHIYSDSQEPGYGIYDVNGNLKFPFHPRISC